MPTVHDLAAALADSLDTARFAADGDPTGVWIASDRNVRSLGLRLEAGRPPYAWADGLDAVLLHRPFGLWPARLPDGFGVLAYHRALDERLAPGYDRAFADALGLTLDDAPLERGGVAVGHVGTLAAPTVTSEAMARLDGLLSGHEAIDGPEPASVSRIAVVGAMTEALVEDAAARGADLYVTGQLRGPARAALHRCGVRAVGVGQARTERWGLGRLAALLAERFPEIEIVTER